ncbi:MAG: DUF1993 domain-containing protein [Pontixanthobacter sp.]
MNLYTTIVPAYRDMLTAMTGMLDKAQAHGGDALLKARIADDMHPLSVQIRFVTNMPGEAMAKLAGDPMVKWEDDNPETLDEAKDRLEKVDAAFAAIDANSFVLPDAPIALNLPNGMAFEMTAAEYVRDWALPQFYFHVTAAYMILRNQGVPLGKADYVPHMRRYATAGPMAD